MKDVLNKLINSELLHVELVALAFILLVLILGLVFGYNIRKFPYPSFLILIIFPLIWFGIKWIISLIGGIPFSGVNKWVWIGVVSIVVIILIARYWPEKWKSSGYSSRSVSFDKNGRMIAPATKEKPWWILFVTFGMLLILVTGLVIMAVKGIKFYETDNPPVVIVNNANPKPAYYEQVSPNAINDFTAGISKSFWTKKGMLYGPIPQNINDTITFSCSGPSGQWSFMAWKDASGEPQWLPIKAQPRKVDGRHTIVANKDCSAEWIYRPQ